MAVEFSAKDWINAIYVAYWGRAADPAGQTYWVDQWGELDDEGNPKEAAWFADTFVTASDEAKDQYDFIRKFIDEEEITTADRVQFVTDIYENLFEKDPADDPGDPDIEGDTALDYWVRMLETGESTPGKFIGDIVFSALAGGEADAEMIQAKVEVAQYITQLAIDKGWDEDDDVLVAWLKGDGADIVKNTKPDNVDAQKAEADQDIPTPDTGNTFTLTASGAELTDARSSKVEPDDVFLTDKDDTIEAGRFLHNATIIDPSNTDQDVLNAEIPVARTITPNRIDNIEIFNLDFGGVASILDMDDVYGVQTVNVTSSTSDLARFINIDDRYQIAPDSTIDMLTVDDDVSILMNGADFTLRGMDEDNDLEQIDIIVESTGSDNILTIHSTGNTTDDILVNGDANLTLVDIGSETEVENNLMQGAKLTALFNYSADLDMTDVEADLFRFDVAFVNSAEFAAGDAVNIELNANANAATFGVDKGDDDDELNIMANIGGAVGLINLASGIDADDQFNLITYTVGDQNQNVTMILHTAASVTINGKGDLGFALTAPTANNAVINASEFEGDFTFASAGGVAATLGGYGDDEISLGQAVIDREVAIYGGAGDDEINLDANIQTGSIVKVYGGDGDDVITLENGAVVTASTLQIMAQAGDDTVLLDGNIGNDSRVTVMGGDGDDTIIWGDNAAISGASRLTLDGGADNDTFIFHQAGFNAITTAQVAINGGAGENQIILGDPTDNANQVFTLSADVTRFEVKNIDEIVLDGQNRRDVMLTIEDVNDLRGEFNFVGKGNTVLVDDLSIHIVDTGVNTNLSNPGVLEITHNAGDSGGLDAFYIYASAAGTRYTGTKNDDTIFVGTNNATAAAFESATAGFGNNVSVAGGEGDDSFVFALGWGGGHIGTVTAAMTAGSWATIRDYDNGDNTIKFNLGYDDIKAAPTTAGELKLVYDGGNIFEDGTLHDGDNILVWSLVDAGDDKHTWLQIMYDADPTAAVISTAYYAIRLQGTTFEEEDISLDLY